MTAGLAALLLIANTQASTARPSVQTACAAATIGRGGWSQTPQGDNPGTLLEAYFSTSPKPSIVIGCSLSGGKTLTFTSAAAVRKFLPYGTTPNVLKSSATNPSSSAAGAFAGQVLALELNVRLSELGLRPAGLASFILPSGPAAGRTVGQVLADAHTALGGCGLPSYASKISVLNEIVDGINSEMCYVPGDGGGGATNQPPVVAAGANQTITLPATATLAGSVTDDGLPAPGSVSIAWSQLSGPMPSLVTSPSAASTSAAFMQPGVYTLQLTGSDGELSSSSTTQVTVLDGPPALGPLPNRTMPVGSSLSMRLIATDPNPNDTLTYFLEQAPGGTTLDANFVVRWTAGDPHIGTQTFTARVVDAAGHSDTKSFQVTVVDENRAPRLSPQADAEVRIGAGFVRPLTATDPDPGDTLIYSLSSGPAGMQIDGSTLSWNPVGASPGVYAVTVAVTDSGGLVDSALFKVTVIGATPPYAADDRFEVPLGSILSVPAPGVLANDLTGDGGPIAALQQTQPGKGVVSAFQTDGSFTYQAPSSPQGPALVPVQLREFMPAQQNPIEQPLVADMDGDGKPEIIVFYLNATIDVIRSDTGARLFAVNVLPAAQVGGKLCAFDTFLGSMAAGDIDDDGAVELVFKVQCALDARDDGAFSAGAANRLAAVVYDSSQTSKYRVKWMTPLLPENPRGAIVAGIGASITLARLATGEAPSVLFGQTYDADQCKFIRSTFTDRNCRVVFALNGIDGAVRRLYYSTPTAIFFGGYSLHNDVRHGGFMAPLVADVDDDGEMDILYEGSLWAASGALKRQFDGTLERRATQSSAVADVDGDGEMEIVTLDVKLFSESLRGTFGALRAWDPDGAVVWTAPVPKNNIITRLSVADVNRDGRPDFIFGGPALGPVTHSHIWVIDHAGQLRWVRDMRGATAMEFHHQTFPVYDLNGDGIMEMVVAFGRNTLRLLRADTGADQTSWTYPGAPEYFHQGGAINVPLIVDVDGTGEADILWHRVAQPGFGNYLAIIGSGAGAWESAPSHFNQLAFWETNFGVDGSIPPTYPRHTTDPRTNVLAQMPQAPRPPGFMASEETSFTYAAVDTAGGSGAATVTLSLLPQNRPPVFVSKPPRFYVNPGTGTVTIQYTALAVDPDAGDSVTYGIGSMGLVQFSGIVSINPVTGFLSVCCLRDADLSGILTATDSAGAKAFQSFTIRRATGSTTVPNVVGMTLSAATSTLSTAMLEIADVVEQYSTAAAGVVLSQAPSGGVSLAQGDAIALVVSRGPTPILVPNVVGKPGTVAATQLAAMGFTVNTVMAFSATPAGVVTGQTPPGGSLSPPSASNPIVLTVSAGQGLKLGLNRSVTTADQPLTVTAAAFNADGTPAPLPSLSFTLTAEFPEYLGSLPELSGNSIIMSPATHGTFRVTATDTANARTATATFVVLPPRVPGATTNGQAYAQLFETLEFIHALREPLRAALDAGNVAQMTTLLQQFVTLWRGVDLDDLRLSQPIVTPDGFAPTLEMMAAWGHSATPDDVLTKQILKDAIVDVVEWTRRLKAAGTPLGQLEASADQFAVRAARIEGLRISRYGGIANSSEYTRWLSHAVPEFYEALSEELAALTGLEPRTGSYPLMASPEEGTGLPPSGPIDLPSALPAPAGSLAELAVTTAVKYVVDKILEEANPLYKGTKAFSENVKQQAAWTAGAVMLASELRQYLQGGDVAEVVSGASLSFREFKQSPAWIEAHADADPAVNVVMVIGPDLLSAVNGLVNNLVDQLKKGYSFGVSALTNPQAYRNANDVKEGFVAIAKGVKGAVAAIGPEMQRQAKLIFQSPSETLNGCVFSNHPSCRQLVYASGLEPVYTFEPPPGWGLSGIPTPIVVVVFNAATGETTFGTPLFMPCTIVPVPGGTTKQIQCPNNSPIPQAPSDLPETGSEDGPTQPRAEIARKE